MQHAAGPSHASGRSHAACSRAIACSLALDRSSLSIAPRSSSLLAPAPRGTACSCSLPVPPRSTPSRLRFPAGLPLDVTQLSPSKPPRPRPRHSRCHVTPDRRDWRVGVAPRCPLRLPCRPLRRRDVAPRGSSGPRRPFHLLTPPPLTVGGVPGVPARRGPRLPAPLPRPWVRARRCVLPGVPARPPRRKRPAWPAG
jgi:hypothetical protein